MYVSLQGFGFDIEELNYIPTKKGSAQAPPYCTEPHLKTPFYGNSGSNFAGFVRHRSTVTLLHENRQIVLTDVRFALEKGVLRWGSGVDNSRLAVTVHVTVPAALNLRGSRLG